MKVSKLVSGHMFFSLILLMTNSGELFIYFVPNCSSFIVTILKKVITAESSWNRRFYSAVTVKTRTWVILLYFYERGIVSASRTANSSANFFSNLSKIVLSWI